MSLSRDRLKQLEEIEQDIVRVIESAALAVTELSKAEPSEDFVVARSTEFLKGLEGIEKNLNEQISYLSQVSTNHQHEGSIYSQEKSFELACAATDFIGGKLKQLEHKCLPPDTKP